MTCSPSRCSNFAGGKPRSITSKRHKSGPVSGNSTVAAAVASSGRMTDRLVGSERMMGAGRCSRLSSPSFQAAATSAAKRFGNACAAESGHHALALEYLKG